MWTFATSPNKVRYREADGTEKDGVHPLPFSLKLYCSRITSYSHLFLAALSLHCCSRAASSCSALASHCSGFSGFQAWALECGLIAVACRLSCPEACGIFPEQGSNLCPPALAGRFLTTGPPEKFHPPPFNLVPNTSSPSME